MNEVYSKLSAINPSQLQRFHFNACDDLICMRTVHCGSFLVKTEGLETILVLFDFLNRDSSIFDRVVM